VVLVSIAQRVVGELATDAADRQFVAGSMRRSGARPGGHDRIPAEAIACSARRRQTREPSGQRRHQHRQFDGWVTNLPPGADIDAALPSDAP
jgi:hypothetical protein